MTDDRSLTYQSNQHPERPYLVQLWPEPSHHCHYVDVVTDLLENNAPGHGATDHDEIGCMDRSAIHTRHPIHIAWEPEHGHDQIPWSERNLGFGRSLGSASYLCEFVPRVQSYQIPRRLGEGHVDALCEACIVDDLPSH